MPDLSNAADVLRFCAEKRSEMERIFWRNGRYESKSGLSFAAFLFATHAISFEGAQVITGPRFDRVKLIEVDLPRAVHEMLPSSQHTDLFARLIRSLAKGAKAVGTLLLTEQWAIAMELDPALSADEQRRIAMERRATMPENLADAPGRIETLGMYLEHSATGRKSWWAEIQRNPLRLKRWEAQNHDDPEGRLVNLSHWQS